MSQMTWTQQGMVGQLLFAALVMMGSGGAIKAGFQTTDDEGRDVDIHLGGTFSREFGIQVKTSRVLRRYGAHLQLTIIVRLTQENVVDSPRYWYLLAHLDLQRMRLSDHVFLVPSREVHAHLTTDPQTGQPVFIFQASMAPNADDRWTKYRLRSTELGKRLRTLLRSAPKRSALETELAGLQNLSGVCWLGL
jgi:hypothetical protein